MKNIMGQPAALKQVNLSLIRRAFREKGSATRAEIAALTRISGTTVRTLLGEMIVSGELCESGFDESIGGRKAVRYSLQKDKFFGAALTLSETEIRYIIVNICGEVCSSGGFAASPDVLDSACALLDKITAEQNISAIGIGVPGIVDGMQYMRKNADGALLTYSLGEQIRKRYNVPVVLENDLNAVALGFGKRHLKQFPQESCGALHSGYIHFGSDCLSAGFLCNGKILRGNNNFVGELGLFPADGDKSLDDVLASPLSDEEFILVAAKIIAGVCCILNPRFIAVGGENFRKGCLPKISEYINKKLPAEMRAEVVLADNHWENYYEGMAMLTAEQIFAEVKLVKE